MLNIDTTVFPSAAPPEGQIASDANLTSADSPVADLFSVALASETGKEMLVINVDSAPNVEGTSLTGMAVPATQTPAETPDAPEPSPAKNQDRADAANYLLLLPFFAFSTNDPLWKNLPNRGNPAGKDAEPDPTLDAAIAASMCTALSVATPAPIPVSADAPGLADPQEETQPVTVSIGAKAAPREQQRTVKGLSPRMVATTTAAKETQEQVVPILEARAKVDPANEASSPSKGSARPARASDRPEKAAVASSPDAARPDLSPKTPSPELMVENLVAPHDDTVNSLAKEQSVPLKGERLDTPRDTPRSDDELDKLSEPRTPQALNPVATTADSSHQGNLNGDKRHANRADVDLQITVRSAPKETNPLAGHWVPQVRPESKGSELGLDLRSGVLFHEVSPHSGESTNAPEVLTTAQSEHWSQIEKSNVLSQLIEKARALRWDRNAEIVVSLKPESLGRISMRAFLVDRTMVAMIAAESDKVRQLIQVEIPAIQRSLQDSGIAARVVVSQQDDVSLNYNNTSNGQSRFRQDTPESSPGDDVTPSPNNAKPEVADSRYNSHSVHLIA